jgi:hypothetical protein
MCWIIGWLCGLTCAAVTLRLVVSMCVTAHRHKMVSNLLGSALVFGLLGLVFREKPHILQSIFLTAVSEGCVKVVFMGILWSHLIHMLLIMHLGWWNWWKLVSMLPVYRVNGQFSPRQTPLDMNPPDLKPLSRVGPLEYEHMNTSGMRVCGSAHALVCA